MPMADFPVVVVNVGFAPTIFLIVLIKKSIEIQSSPKFTFPKQFANNSYIIIFNVLEKSFVFIIHFHYI